MAVALDANLGSNSSNGTTTVTVTTSAAAVAGAKIVALVSWFHGTSASMTVSGGGLTWASRGQVNNGADRFAIWDADAPAGLASGTVITATQASGGGGLLVGLVSFTGVGTLDTTAQSAGTTGTSWTSGSAANSTVGALFIGGAGNETTGSTTSTATNGTEIHDFWNLAAGQGMASGYVIAAGTSSQGITGTWSTSSTANTGFLVVYNPAGGAAVATQAVRRLPRSLGPRAVGPLYFAGRQQQAVVEAATPLSDSDSGTGTETSDVQATVPGSDTGTGSEAASTFVTLSDADSGTGTDAQVSIVSPVSGSDSATGSETDSTLATVPGSDSATGTEGGVVGDVSSGGDSGAGTEAGTVSVTASSSDTATATETDSTTATVPGSESGSGTDAAATSVTLSGADSATGTDTGSVQDITGGPTTISDSDSGTATETGTVLDITPPPVETGGGGVADEQAIYGFPPSFRALTDGDTGRGSESARVRDLTPPPEVPPLELPVPRRLRRVQGEDSARSEQAGRVEARAASADVATATESAVVVDVGAEAARKARLEVEEEQTVLSLLGLL